MWLASYDPEDVWPPTEVALLRRVRIGRRADHAWAHLDLPIHLADGPDVDLVILGARHVGYDIWTPRDWPVHVYICTVPADMAERDDFGLGEVQIVRWGTLHETLKSALSNEV